jgi:hypothetical protein
MVGVQVFVLRVLRPLDQKRVLGPAWAMPGSGAPARGNRMILLGLGLKKKRGEVCKVLTPKGPDVADLGDFEIGELNVPGV